MTIVARVEVIPSQTFIQGDARDPLGIWGFRTLVTGDAGGEGLQVTAFMPEAQRSAFVFACYYAHMAKLTGTNLGGALCKIRLLTNWPNVDPQAGVQAFGSVYMSEFIGSTPGFAGAFQGVGNDGSSPLVHPNDRFMLLYDPRQGAFGDLDIVELQLAENENLATYTFEGYGYYWDRSVMETPGGPRHPGSG